MTVNICVHFFIIKQENSEKYTMAQTIGKKNTLHIHFPEVDYPSSD